MIRASKLLFRFQLELQLEFQLKFQILLNLLETFIGPNHINQCYHRVRQLYKGQDQE